MATAVVYLLLVIKVGY